MRQLAIIARLRADGRTDAAADDIGVGSKNPLDIRVHRP
jgi:hypothetical protein